MGTQFEAFFNDPEVAAIIKMKATSISRHKLFRRSYRRQIEKDMWSHLSEQCHKYDP